MARDWCNCCSSFWAISCLFTSLAAQKVEISKQWKKTLEISFYTSVPKSWSYICYAVLEIWHMTHVIAIFRFGQFFSLLPPKKTKLQKNEKNSWRYHHFTHVYQKLLDDIRFLRYGGWQVDGRKKWHIELGAPPKNFITSKYQVMIYYKNFITLTLLDIGQKTFSVRG